MLPGFTVFQPNLVREGGPWTVHGQGLQKAWEHKSHLCPLEMQTYHPNLHPRTQISVQGVSAASLWEGRDPGALLPSPWTHGMPLSPFPTQPALSPEAKLLAQEGEFSAPAPSPPQGSQDPVLMRARLGSDGIFCVN